MNVLENLNSQLQLINVTDIFDDVILFYLNRFASVFFLSITVNQGGHVGFHHAEIMFVLWLS